MFFGFFSGTAHQEKSHLKVSLGIRIETDCKSVEKNSTKGKVLKAIFNPQRESFRFFYFRNMKTDALIYLFLVAEVFIKLCILVLFYKVRD